MSRAFTPPPISSPMAKMKSEFRWLTAVTMLGLAVIALVMCALQYHRERIATLQVLESAAVERVTALDSILAAAVRPVTALRKAAESPATDSPGPISQSTWGDGSVAFASAEGAMITAPSATAQNAEDVADQTRLALSLARLEPILFQLAPNLVELTFETPRGVAAAFPTPYPVEHDADWTPPTGAQWSDVGRGAGNQGLTVRYSEPARQGDHGVGVAAADISLEFLRHVIEMPDYSGQRLVLVDRARHVLADSRLGASRGRDAMLALGEMLPASLVPDDVFSARPGESPVQLPVQGYTVIVAPLTAAPWVLVCLVPEGALFLRVVPWFTIAFVLIAAVFAAMSAGSLYVSQRFIRPIFKLARLIGAEASGDILPPQRVPAPWQPLFSRVAGAFAASRAQLARAEGAAAQATQATGDHTRERSLLAEALDQEIARRELAESLLDNVPALVLVLDREGRIVRFNRRCESVLGILASAARGRRPWEFLAAPDSADSVRLLAESALRGGGPAHGTSDWLVPDGSPRRIGWTMTAVLDMQGEPSHMVAIGREA